MPRLYNFPSLFKNLIPFPLISLEEENTTIPPSPPTHRIITNSTRKKPELDPGENYAFFKIDDGASEQAARGSEKSGAERSLARRGHFAITPLKRVYQGCATRFKKVTVDRFKRAIIRG